MGPGVVSRRHRRVWQTCEVHRDRSDQTATFSLLSATVRDDPAVGSLRMCGATTQR